MSRSRIVVRAAFAGLLLARLAAPAAAAEGYLIGGGDVLEVNVWKNAELSRNVTVRPDGRITLPLVRDVVATGLTAAELGETLAERLGAFVNAPNVTVTVVEARSSRVYTQGAVAGGAHPLTAPMSARQLLARAGGPLPDADLKRAHVLREGRRLDLDLGPDAASQERGDLVLQSGDILVVPFRASSDERVLVVGEVERPVSVPFRPGMTLLDAFVASGGATPHADLSRARIAREGADRLPEAIPVNIELILKEASFGPNVRLRAGDTLLIPRRPEQLQERVLVVGEVREPSAVEFRKGLTLLDAFVDAGGGTDYADLDDVKVLRALPDGKKDEIRVDLGRVLKKGDLSRNIALQPGDIVVVPR